MKKEKHQFRLAIKKAQRRGNFAEAQRLRSRLRRPRITYERADRGAG